MYLQLSRQKEDLHIPKEKLRKGKRTFRFSGATLFNPQTSKGGGGEGVKWTPIGFSDLKFEAFKQSK